MKEAKNPTVVQVVQKKEWKEPTVEIISSQDVQGGAYHGTHEGAHQITPGFFKFYHS
jgi:hypothetical protein